jgi:hypothetical protein
MSSVWPWELPSTLICLQHVIVCSAELWAWILASLFWSTRPFHPAKGSPYYGEDFDPSIATTTLKIRFLKSVIHISIWAMKRQQAMPHSNRAGSSCLFTFSTAGCWPRFQPPLAALGLQRSPWPQPPQLKKLSHSQPTPASQENSMKERAVVLRQDKLNRVRSSRYLSARTAASTLAEFGVYWGDVETVLTHCGACWNKWFTTSRETKFLGK